jgi:hypothetical protein
VALTGQAELRWQIWSIFTTTLELILSKIREKNNAPPRKSGAGQKTQKSLGLKKIYFGVWGKRKFFAPSPPPEKFLIYGKFIDLL